MAYRHGNHLVPGQVSEVFGKYRPALEGIEQDGGIRSFRQIKAQVHLLPGQVGINGEWDSSRLPLRGKFGVRVLLPNHLPQERHCEVTLLGWPWQSPAPRNLSSMWYRLFLNKWKVSPLPGIAIALQSGRNDGWDYQDEKLVLRTTKHRIEEQKTGDTGRKN